MPRPSEEDRLVLTTLVEWKIIAAGQIEDIGAWRDDHARKGFPQSQFDNGEPNAFWTYTAAIVGWVARRFPSLDPSPVQDVYAAVNAWHKDRNADRIPPQNELEGILAQAMIVASAIHDEIYSRLPSAAPGDRLDRPKAPESASLPAWNGDTGELSYKGAVVKRVKNVSQAVNVIRVLVEFQEAGWPLRIDDPLPHPSSAERVNKTVESLNKNLSAIRFSADGTGQGFRWEAV